MVKKYNIHKNEVVPYLIIQSVLVMIIIIYESFWLKDRGNICIMDGIGLLLNSSMFLILYIINLFHLVSIMKNNFDVQIIVRGRSRKAIWIRESALIMKFNAVTSLIWVVAGMISGKLHSSILNNWSVQNSFYSYTTSTNQITCSLNAVVIIVVIWITIMVYLNILAYVVMLGYWMFNNTYLGMLLLLGMGFFDTWGVEEPLFLKRFIIYGDVWSDTLNIVINILSLIIIALTAFFIGLQIADRKEFISNA